MDGLKAVPFEESDLFIVAALTDGLKAVPFEESDLIIVSLGTFLSLILVWLR